MTSENSLFPLRLFIYDDRGFHDEGIEIVSLEQLNGAGVSLIMKAAMQRGVEIRMTDCYDNLVLHANEGKLLFPDETAIAQAVVERITDDEELG